MHLDLCVKIIKTDTIINWFFKSKFTLFLNTQVIISENLKISEN